MIKKDKLAVIIPIILIIILGIVITNIESIFPTPSAAKKIGEIGEKVNYTSTGLDYGTNPGAEVTIVEFSDFQCPACAMAAAEVHKVIDYYGDKVNFVFKHFPVRDGSEMAAQASECARDQEKFWEYHDLLFANSKVVSAPTLELFAETLELDVDEFSLCLEGGEKEAKVRADFIDGYRNSIKGTPTFFVNDVVLVGAHSFEELKKIIDKELEK